MFEPLSVVSLRASTVNLVDSDATAVASNEVDLGPYIHTGKREAIAFWCPVIIGTDTDETYDNKLQEASSTVDSDFGDIDGASFTQVTPETAGAIQFLRFLPTKRYVRSYLELGGTTASIRDWTGLVLSGRFDT